MNNRDLPLSAIKVENEYAHTTQNFKDLTWINILLGENNSGKTNVLKQIMKQNPQKSEWVKLDSDNTSTLFSPNGTFVFYFEQMKKNCLYPNCPVI